jgi:flagellar assembly factor FliW
MTRRSDDPAEIRFEEGIIGVPRARRFHLLADGDSPVRVLRCLDVEGLALPVIDPTLADPAYCPALAPRVLEIVEAAEGEPLVVLAVTTLSDQGATANLRAPLVINPRLRLAAQVILDDRALPLRAPLRPQ